MFRLRHDLIDVCPYGYSFNQNVFIVAIPIIWIVNFITFSSEDIESQKPLLCPGVTHYAPFFGSEPAKFEGKLANNKAWMDNFDDISYDDSKWFPGTDDSGKPNGSVMTSGSWTAKSIATGNVIKVSAFHTFVFNAKNQIHEARDYFDATGVMAAAMKVD